MENIEHIRIEQDGEIIHTSVALYKFFLSNGQQGMNAYLLYSHLQFTCRLQSTNAVKAEDIYLRKGLGWGINKLKKAKTFLSDAGLIEYKQERSEGGRYSGKYIVIKTTRSPEVQLSHQPSAVPPVNSTSRPEKQMLKETSKCLNKQLNALKSGESGKPSSPVRLEIFKDIAEQFFFDIQEIVRPPTYQNRSPDLTQWAKDIEKIHRIDKRPIDEIKLVAAWAVRDKFWQSNILSGKKLRMKYDKLYLQMQSRAPTGNVVQYDSAKRMKELEEIERKGYEHFNV